MKKSTIILSVAGFVILVLLLGGCTTYNSMVTKEEAVDQSWADVQASYQRRFDLIPNLVNTVKGYAAHESQTLQNVTDARVGLAAKGDSLQQMADGMGSFSGPDSKGPDMSQLQNLNRQMGLYINAVHEAYPDLKANINFLDLQKQLESTENRINQERNMYNNAVKEYNVAIRKFPNNIFAGICGFDKKSPFAAEDGAQRRVDVQF